MKREQGFYWVSLASDPSAWYVMKYSNGHWWYGPNLMDDYVIGEVDERRIINPNEK